MNTKFNFDVVGLDLDLSASLEVIDPQDNRPTVILRAGEEWVIRVSIKSSGADCTSFTGKWEIKSYLESVSAGADYALPTYYLPITPGMSPIVYKPFDMRISGDTIAEEMVTKLVTTITTQDENGKKIPCAALAEGPSIQFIKPDQDETKNKEIEKDRNIKATIRQIASSLEKPDKLWRSLQDICQETGLPLEMVQSILNILGDKVVQSGIKGTKNKPQYTTISHLKTAFFRDPGFRKEYFISQLAQSEPGDTIKIASAQLGLINEYYKTALTQARQSFVMALGAAGVGLIFFLVAVIFLLLSQSQSIAIVSIISGAVIETISGLNFYLYGQTSKQMAYYHHSIEQMNRFLLANSVCEMLDASTKQEARSRLVASIVMDNQQPPQTKVSMEQQPGKTI